MAMEKKRWSVLVAVLIVGLFISGCLVRTYKVEEPRKDITLKGNRGYIQGNLPSKVSSEPVKTTRTKRVVEIELRAPLKIEKGLPEDEPVVTESTSAAERSDYRIPQATVETAQAPAETSEEIVEYRVEKGDTLQKISMKFYGTTRRWQEIYELNKDLLKSPEKIYPGQIIRVKK